MKEKYSIEELIEIMSSIPEDKWITDYFQDNRGGYCAMGHAFRIDLENFLKSQHWFTKLLMWADLVRKPDLEYVIHEFTPIAKSLYELNWPPSEMTGSRKIMEINNGNHHMFQQETPKARVLSALTWLKNQNDAEGLLSSVLTKKHEEEGVLVS